MEKSKKIMRISCALLFVVGTLWYLFKLYGTVHTYLFWTIVFIGILQGFLGFAAVVSTKLGFEHIISTVFAVGFSIVIALFTNACMMHGYWAVVYVALPSILALLVPIFYSFKWNVSVWQDIMVYGLVLVAIFLWDWLEKTPNYFNSYVALQILVIALSVQWLPEKEEAPRPQEL